MNIIDFLNIPKIRTKIRQMFTSNGRGKTVIRTIDYDETKNSFEAITTSVTTSATEIEMPEDTQTYQVFHQTEDAVLYVRGDNTVSSSDIKLEYGDHIEISGTKDFELWMISASGSVDVFVAATVFA